MGSSTAYTYQGGSNNGQWANKHEYDVWGFNTKAPTYNYDPMYRATEPYYTGHPYDGSINIYFAENRFYDAETGTWLSPDPIKDGLNWYAYCENNPTSKIDILGLKAEKPAQQEYFNMYMCLEEYRKWFDIENIGAIVMTKPVENIALSFLGQEHMSLFLKDKNGVWYFFSFESQVKFIEVNDNKILKSSTTVNEWISENYSTEIKDYNRLVSINGDFNSSISEIKNMSVGDNGYIVSYDEKWYHKPLNIISSPFGGYDKDTGYSLIYNNCGHSAMNVLEKGELQNGQTVGEYLKPYKILYNIKSTSTLPSDSMNMLEMAISE